jgi:hypothetical protein
MRRTGLTAIELLVSLASVLIAFWLAALVVWSFESVWRWLGAAVVFVAAYAAAYFLLLVGFICVFGSLSERLDRHRQFNEKTDMDP